MRGRSALVVALFATVAIFIQNGGSALAFGWALIHGAGPSAVLAFLPLGIGLGVLWGGFRYLSRKNSRHASGLFTVYALAMLLLNEALLPSTPLKTWKSERGMQQADVRNIRDEIVLSAKGNPIGIKITYEVMFPQTVVCNVHASALGVVGGEAPSYLSYNLDLHRRHQESINPAPSSEGLYNEFRKGSAYRFSETRVPGFLEYDDKTQLPCLRIPPYSDLSEADILSAVKRRGNVRYHLEIMLTSDYVPVAITRASYVTSREYDLEAMYQTIVTEGHQRCSS